MKRVAIITSSSRNPRANPYVSEYVQKTMEKRGFTGFSLHQVDLRDFNLNMFSETGIPAQLPRDNPTPHYDQDATRAWSAEMMKYDGYIFVTPQYNASIPASLKNAIDHLFNEWRGKPAGIVSYGGSGGAKATGHLKQILSSVTMKVLPTTPAIRLSRDTLDNAVEYERVTDAQVYKWEGEGIENQLFQLTSELETVLK